MHAELTSQGIRGHNAALAIGHFGEFLMDFIKLRNYIARQKAYVYVEFNSPIIGATSMFKLSITSRWVLVASRGWARLILDRRRDLINDRSSRAATASPLAEPRSAASSTTPLATHAVPFTTANTKRHSSLALPYTFAYNLAPPLGG